MESERRTELCPAKNTGMNCCRFLVSTVWISARSSLVSGLRWCPVHTELRKGNSVFYQNHIAIIIIYHIPEKQHIQRVRTALRQE